MTNRPSAAWSLGVALAIGASCSSGNGTPSLSESPCGPKGECPSGTTCGADGLCHGPSSGGVTDSAAGDAGVTDTGFTVDIVTDLAKNEAGELIPCVSSNPADDVDFGEIKAGTTKRIDVGFGNCGPEPLDILALVLDSSETPPVFSIDYAMILAPGFDPSAPPSTSHPLVFPSGAIVTVPVIYAPAKPSPIGLSSKQPIPSEAFLVIQGKNTEPRSIKVIGVAL